MGYNIVRSEINLIAASLFSNGGKICDNLSKIKESFNELIENDNFTGNGADAVKAYLKLVHISAIDALMLAIEEFKDKMTQYAAGFSNFDSFDEAVLNEDLFAEVIQKINALQTSMDNAHETSFKAEDDVIELVPERLMKLLWTYNDPIEEERTKIKQLKNGIATYDTDYKDNKLQNVRDLIDDAKRLVHVIKDKGVISFDDINVSDYFTDEQYIKLSEDFKDSCTYLVENQESIQEDVNFISDYVEKVRKREEEEARKNRIEKGLILIGSAGLGFLSMTFTAGTSAPVVVEVLLTIETAAVGVDSTAKLFEGFQEFYFGVANDIETPSINYVRDSLFQGDQDKYDLFSYTLNVTYQGLGSTGTILGAGRQALSSGGNVFAAELGALSEEVFKNGIGKIADFGGEKLAGACSDDMLAQFLIQTTFSIGVAKKTKKTAKKINKSITNKVSSFSYNNSSINTNTAAKVYLSEANKGFAEEIFSNDAKRRADSVIDGTNPHILGECDWFDDVSESEKMRYEKWEATRKSGIDIKDINDFIFAKNRPSKAEFEKMKITPHGSLTPEQFRQMKIIRESIPGIDSNVILRKTIPWTQIDNYLREVKPYDTIMGFVAKADDVKMFKTYSEMRDGLALDYSYKENGIEIFPYPEGGDSYGYIEFKVSEDAFFDVPYGNMYGGEYNLDQPYTGNGFTMSKDFDVPEYYINKQIHSKGLKPTEGQIHLVVGGEDVVVADFDPKEGKYNYHKEEKIYRGE
ncbi:MAG: hypothetical protein IIT48_03950 [Lachnospiraceae bacterium]|nr:hypothetical protein [Lachnospiraceae bacterium]